MQNAARTSAVPASPPDETDSLATRPASAISTTVMTASTTMPRSSATCFAASSRQRVSGTESHHSIVPRSISPATNELAAMITKTSTMSGHMKFSSSAPMKPSKRVMSVTPKALMNASGNDAMYEENRSAFALAVGQNAAISSVYPAMPIANHRSVQSSSSRER